ncbi:hypothetical protein B0I35DRAFT_256180 [Stachybotrys elegans]|uniref:Uncharacterized protein n=1 Tax=Stachybotrys elegans TaxID=80388 RepID=A0A8K0WQ71_9HYPO|nr:hypothetical protein B0I35DRAFT_256180 [Stachybotrys elegans]
MDGPRPASAGGKAPHLSINLSSNNPFRNRAASPLSFESGLASPRSPFDDPEPRPRPVSRNPFFDPSQQPLKSPGAMSTTSDSKVTSAENIFDSLTLDDKLVDAPRPSNAPPPPRRPMNRPPPPRGGSDGPQGERRSASGSRHRPTPSQEDDMRARKPGSGSGPRPGPPGSRPPQRRPRRNSDTSLIDLDVRPITDEERKMIEERRREQEKKRREGRDRESKDREAKDREGKEREGKDRDGKDRSRSHRPSRRMDLIDKLDATSIYGTGCM